MFDRHRRLLALAGASLAIAPVAYARQPPTKLPKIVVVWSFAGPTGTSPSSGLTLGTDGLLYGTTPAGAAGYGTIYQFSPQQQTLDVLYTIELQDNFGIYPSGLTKGSDGVLYGTTAHGGNSGMYYNCYDNGATGCGTVFSITPGSKPAVLHQFDLTDGWEPGAPPVEGPDGAFYGTTFRGGLYNLGTVYKITLDGSVVTLHSFSGKSTDGANPRAPLVLGPNPDTLYGTTTAGGTSGMGTIFKVALTGRTSTIHSFTGTTADGRNPTAPLILASNGKFYGTTLYGGGTGCPQAYAGCGTVYEISPSGKFTMRHVFQGGASGEYPVGPVMQAVDGSLYGTTENGGAYNTQTCFSSCGTVFKMRLNGAFKILASFGPGTGWNPTSGLTQGSDLLLYGTTPTGDTGFGSGTIYAVLLDNQPGSARRRARHETHATK